MPPNRTASTSLWIARPSAWASVRKSRSRRTRLSWRSARTSRARFWVSSASRSCRSFAVARIQGGGFEFRSQERQLRLFRLGERSLPLALLLKAIPPLFLPHGKCLLDGTDYRHGLAF